VTKDNRAADADADTVFLIEIEIDQGVVVEVVGGVVFDVD